MINIFVILSATLNWSNPLTYIFLAALIVVFAGIMVIVKTNQYMKEAGITSGTSFFDFDDILKWMSVNEKTTGVILFVIVLAGVILALTYS